MRTRSLIERMIGWQGLTLGILLLTLAEVLHDYFVAAVVAAELGAVLISLVLLHLIYEHFLRQENKADLMDSVRGVMAESNRLAEELRKSGIVRVHERLPIDVIQREFSAETSRIRILTTWIHEYNALSPALREAVRGGAHLELLMLNPDSAFTRQRGLDLGYDDTHGKESLQTIVRELRRDFATPELRERVHLRYYDCLPSVALHQAGDMAIVSPCFPHYTLGTQVLQLEVMGATTLYGQFVEQEFEHLWRQGTAVDL